MLDVPYRMCGDIVLDPSAAIAPGSLLLVEPGCQLQIAPGVCIGAGCLIHVFGGDLTLEVGAIVGSAVLLVGSGKIGAKACIGAAATLVNPTVEAGQMILQNSFHGSLELDGAVDLITPEVLGATDAPENLTIPPETKTNGAMTPEEDASANASGQPTRGSEGPAIASQVYGLEAFYRLMTMLFPHRDFPSGVAPPPGTPSAPSTHHQPDGGEAH